MAELTFGEQVKIILSRKGMTIKELAELVEQRTGKPMSRQNMTQRLGRDNFQEKDMRLIADILGCKFQLSIMEMDQDAKPVEKPKEKANKDNSNKLEREITVGELLDMSVEGTEAAEEKKIQEKKADTVESAPLQNRLVSEKKKEDEPEERKMLRKGVGGYYRSPVTASVRQTDPDVEKTEKKEAQRVGDFNPYTGKEYKTNSVRMHPKRIGYVQVYDQEQHKWTDMTEWAFLGYQERKKALLGKDYEPPIYLD